MKRLGNLTALAIVALASSLITISIVHLAPAAHGDDETRYEGDSINAFASSRWYLNDAGETRFALTALRPTDLRCLSEHGDEAADKCSFERITVFETSSNWELRPLRHSPSWTTHPKFQNGELHAIMDHMLAPQGTPVTCTSGEGRVTGYSRTVSADGSVWCKAQFRRSVEDPRLTIRVGNAQVEVGAP